MFTQSESTGETCSPDSECKDVVWWTSNELIDDICIKMDIVINEKKYLLEFMIICLLGYTYKSDTYLHYNGSTILDTFDDRSKAIQECSINAYYELIVDSGCDGHG